MSLKTGIQLVLVIPLYVAACVLIWISNRFGGTTFVITTARRVMPRSTPERVAQILRESAEYIAEEETPKP